MEVKTILVLNMGMKSIRSILFDDRGYRLAFASLPIETSLTGEMVTQQPQEWWEKACRVIRETILEAGGIPVDFLTVTSSSSCLVCVDRQGEALLPCMMVSDRRAGEESKFMSRAVSFPGVYARTGVGADPSLMIPKALWIKNHESGVFDKIYKMLSPNDYLIAKFTGTYVTDYMNAHKWHYDIQQKRYATELLKEVGIPETMLPEVVPPGTCAGKISGYAVKETGLMPETRLIVTTYDAICSFIGSGVLEEGQASDVSGTVTVFRAASRNKVSISEKKIQQIPYYEGGMHIVGGSNNLGGGLIEWVKQCYYRNEVLPYEQMEKDAGEASIGAGGVIFLPYLLGERAPIWDSSARGVFFGLERMHTRKEMTRAVFESTGFIDLDMIAAVEESGLAIESIRLSGGLARLGLISQIKADMTGREVHVLSEFETTATGAAMMAFYGQGVYDSLQDAAKRFVKIRMTIRPDQENHEKYQKLYRLYKETYRTLRPLLPKRLELTEKLYGSRRIRIENL